ncbi:DUF6221 family protein [Nonomuraea fuscirosea]|uniref:DUF6221 family protein n=1 Tax=Nonomuraea fuscirosea TaxID=1291556 RepID=UPI00344553E5
MDELITFMRARLDEDERGARDATPGPWSYDPGKEWYDGDDFVTMTNGQEFVGYGGLSLFRGAVCITGDAGHAQSAKDAEYIAGHDPARTLRETEARRRALARHVPGPPTEAGRRTMARHSPAPPTETAPLPDAEPPSGTEPPFRTELASGTEPEAGAGPDRTGPASRAEPVAGTEPDGTEPDGTERDRTEPDRTEWAAEADGPARCQYDGQPWPCLDLRDLAAPYADHPDYRDEWRP